MDFKDLIDADKSLGYDDHGRPLFAAKRKQAVGYTSRKHAGRGVVVHGYTGETGEWVTLLDKERGAFVTVRPSQVTR